LRRSNASSEAVGKMSLRGFGFVAGRLSSIVDAREL